jgi:hypothetical protein
MFFVEKTTPAAVTDRSAPGADLMKSRREEPLLHRGRGLAALLQRVPLGGSHLVFGARSAATYFLATPLGTRLFSSTKNRPLMAGSKDHTEVSTTNIIKPTMKALSADDQQPFDDLIRRGEVLWLLAKRHDKEDEELRQQLTERRGKAKEKYLSYFTLVGMASLLPSPQAPTISIPDQSFEAFIEQLGNLLKDGRVRMKNLPPLVFPRMILIWNHLRLTQQLQMGHPWPNHHMVCRCVRVTITVAAVRHMTGFGHSRTVRESSQTVQLHRGMSDVFRRIVRLYTGPHADHLGSAIYSWIVWVYPRIVRPGREPSDPLC